MMTETKFIYSLTKKLSKEEHKIKPDLRDEYKNSIKKDSAYSLARKLYESDDQVNLFSEQNLSDMDLVQRTNEYLTSERCTIFGGMIRCSTLQWKCEIPIIKHTPSETSFILVKTGYRIKIPEDICLIGYVWRIVKNYPIRKKEIYLLHLNGNYSPSERLDLDELFVSEKVTRRAIDFQLIVDKEYFS